MTVDFFNAFHAEWLKQRRSLGPWLIVVGAFFTPAIITVVRLLNHHKLPTLYAADGFWTQLWNSAWESMAIFFLPMIAILATSLMTQIEYRNNTWKQVHVLPLHPAMVFFAKFAIVLLLLAQFFLLFNIGIYLTALLPFLLVGGTPYPQAPLPLLDFLAQNTRYFIDCLPIVAAQYLLSLHFRSFLLPIGVGFLVWVGAVGALSWKYGYALPYTYTMLDYLKQNPGGRAVIPAFELHWLALGYFAAFIVVGYLLFVHKAHKG